MTSVPFESSDFDDDVERDPDGLGADALALVRDAAALLQDAAVPRPAAVNQVMKRVKFEAVLGAVLGTVGGSIARVARAAPDLLGLVDDDNLDEGSA